MDFSLSQLAAGFVFGVFGFYLLKRGRATAHLPWIALGAVMMGYSYFVSSPLLTWGLGSALLWAAYLLR